MNSLEKIYKLFEDSNESDYRLEKEIGLKRASISNWRRGLGNPAIEAVKKIARYFNVSTDYLLDMTDNPKPHY